MRNRAPSSTRCVVVVVAVAWVFLVTAGCSGTQPPQHQPVVESFQAPTIYPPYNAKIYRRWGLDHRFGFCRRGPLPYTSDGDGSMLKGALSMASAPDGGVALTGSACGDRVLIQTKVEGSFHGSTDAYIMKIGADGEVLWARLFGGVSEDYGAAVVVAADETTYVVGRFNGLVDFDSSEEESWQQGFDDIFVSAFSPQGDLWWVRSFGGPGEHDARDIALTSTGDLIVVGRIGGTVDFDPGPGEDRRRLQEEPGSREGDAFVVSLSPQGEVLWAQTFGGPGRDEAISVATAPDGGVVVTGNFQRTVDFNPGPGSDYRSIIQGGMDSGVFVVGFGPGGEYRWSRTLHGTARHVAVGPEGATFVIRDSWTGVTITKLSAEGEHLWSRGISWRGSLSSKFLVATPSGAVVMAGTFRHTVDFDPGDSEDARRCRAWYNAAFVTMLGSDGEYMGTRSFEGDRWQSFESVTISPGGDLIIASLVDRWVSTTRHLSLRLNKVYVADL